MTAEATVRVKVVPEIDEEALRDQLLEVIAAHAIMKPGETLVIRTTALSPAAMGIYQQQLDRHVAGTGLPFRVLVVHGDELAVAKPESGEAFAARVRAVIRQEAEQAARTAR